MVVLALALTGCVGETQRLVFPPAVRGALLHAKTAVVDGVWSTVGSANMDWRSFLHNDEINVVVLGEGFGREMTTLFEADVAHSVPIDAAAWQGVMAPARTPAAIVQRMGAEIARAMASPEMKASLAAQGAYSISTTPERYAAFFSEELDRYKRTVDSLGIKLD
jgi:hypothetical protein